MYQALQGRTRGLQPKVHSFLQLSIRSHRIC
uniref:Predicted protein n=1 Tax=Hordeum vulgare subsp. vulgare TaxID=112509 RepID=F2EB40_HORVV|nr:predicted protein [Hordeum vulgare subsp. vulgare]